MTVDKQLNLSFYARQRKETFVVLQRYFVPVFSAMLFLKNLERDGLGKEEANAYRQQIEDIFHRQLKIAPPWRTTAFWQERLQQDLQNFKPPPGITLTYTPKEKKIYILCGH